MSIKQIIDSGCGDLIPSGNPEAFLKLWNEFCREEAPAFRKMRANELFQSVIFITKEMSGRETEVDFIEKLNVVISHQVDEWIKSWYSNLKAFGDYRMSVEYLQGTHKLNVRVSEDMRKLFDGSGNLLDLAAIGHAMTRSRLQAFLKAREAS